MTSTGAAARPLKGDARPSNRSECGRPANGEHPIAFLQVATESTAPPIVVVESAPTLAVLIPQLLVFHRQQKIMDRQATIASD